MICHLTVSSPVDASLPTHVCASRKTVLLFQITPFTSASSTTSSSSRSTCTAPSVSPTRATGPLPVSEQTAYIVGQTAPAPCAVPCGPRTAPACHDDLLPRVTAWPAGPRVSRNYTGPSRLARTDGQIGRTDWLG
jgi:hypothetical protein